MAEEQDPDIGFCLGKDDRGTSDDEEMRKHVGHKIQVVSFPRGVGILKVAMGCVTCNRVLVGYDNPDCSE